MISAGPGEHPAGERPPPHRAASRARIQRRRCEDAVGVGIERGAELGGRDLARHRPLGDGAHLLADPLPFRHRRRGSARSSWSRKAVA